MTDWNSANAYYSFRLNETSEKFVRILNTTTALESRLLIDNLNITDYQPSDEHSWLAYNAMITPAETDKLRDTDWNLKGAYLNSNAVDDVLAAMSPLDSDTPFVQSGYLRDGLGDISFWYRRWDAAMTPNILLKVAPTAETPAQQWVTIASIPAVTNNEFQYFQHAVYDTENHFLRIYGDDAAGIGGRVCLDDILVTAPFGAEVTIDNLTLDPPIPLPTNTVHIEADITELFLGPSNVTMKAYYRLGDGDWGTWQGLNEAPMVPVASNGLVVTYRTVDPLPARPIDALVQYYVAADYDGLFSHKTSPNNYRDFTAPDWHFPVDLNTGLMNTNPYYYVFSCLPGQAWINEVSYFNSTFYDENYEFVEIAGQGGINVGTWRIELVQTDETLYDHVEFPGNRLVPVETNGFGFIVYGDAGVPGVDYVFTNVLQANMAQNGGIRLVRSMGAYDEMLCYGNSGAAYSMTNLGYTHIGHKSDTFSNSGLFREGEGGGATNFTWTYRTGYGTEFRTASAINIDQTLEEYTPPPPVIEILITGQWETGSQVWLVFNCNATYDIQPVPWYSTNLLQSNDWWQASGVSYSHTDGVYTQSMDAPPGSPAYYKVKGTGQ